VRARSSARTSRRGGAEYGHEPVVECEVAQRHRQLIERKPCGALARARMVQPNVAVGEHKDQTRALGPSSYVGLKRDLPLVINLGLPKSARTGRRMISNGSVVPCCFKFDAWSTAPRCSARCRGNVRRGGAGPVRTVRHAAPETTSRTGFPFRLRARRRKETTAAPEPSCRKAIRSPAVVAGHVFGCFAACRVMSTLQPCIISRRRARSGGHAEIRRAMRDRR